MGCHFICAETFQIVEQIAWEHDTVWKWHIILVQFGFILCDVQVWFERHFLE